MDYEINRDTQVLLPLENETKIIETENEYIINNTVFNVIEHSCEYFGSTYEGRKIGTKNLLGITHKSPIIIEESNKIIFFPTTSPERNDCIWLNLSQIASYKKVNNDSSLITFQNGDTLEINISIGSLTNQILRATRLKYVLEERTK
ncbi:MAG: competence protein ComK [Bacilli bacterium]|nr:competence protein ComK [Bacilli bacterium]